MGFPRKIETRARLQRRKFAYSVRARSNRSRLRSCSLWSRARWGEGQRCPVEWRQTRMVVDICVIGFEDAFKLKGSSK